MILKTALRRNERGVVLVIVLALVLLLTTLIVAYISRAMMDRVSSNTSFNQAKADELARSALDIIVGDFKQEIVNGSSVVAPVPAAASYSPIYEATNNAYMIPTQNWPGQPTGGAASTIPNLIRISSPTTSAIAFPGVDHPASAVVSTTPSANGRVVTPTRWNQHYLIPCVNSATSSAPINGFTAPSWVYVTSSGPTVITAPSTTVIGRYAYAVYNEGGLLDVNSAGYPSTSTAAQYGGKGSSLGYADLTQLTDSSGNQILTRSQIDQLVGWRNYASLQQPVAPAGNPTAAPPPTPFSGGSFGSFVMNAGNAASYLTSITNAPSSFLNVSSAVYNNKTDQAFLSRQELLNLQNSIGFPASALQYLGTFSREINAPTFYYPAPGTPTFTDTNFNASPSNDPVTNTTNLNILSLRMANAGMAPDGFTWNAGDPLVSRRFSLGRLAWLTYEGPSADLSQSDPLYNKAGTDAAIQAFFGLQWVALNKGTTPPTLDHWNYVGPSGSTVQASIETLSQVAAEATSREPNFFELLKAAIHSDSLGGWYGSTASGANTATFVGNSDLADNLLDLQILRIGANIIDQANTDDYPRIIAYNPAGTVLYAYGIEDLPYISALAFRSISNWTPTSSTVLTDQGAPARQLSDQIVPVLWNPHRTINTPPGSGIPNIRLYMVGQVGYSLCGGSQIAPVTNTTTNDNAGYTSSTNPLRFNEIALSSGSTFLYGAAERNVGSITINTTQYPLSNFQNPTLLQVTSGISATGNFVSPVTSSPNYPGLPYHLNEKIYGLTLQNLVYSQPRMVTTASQPTDIPTLTVPSNGFDGYWTLPGPYNKPIAPSTGYAGGANAAHHNLNIGTGSVGLNVVLQYQDPNDLTGNTWQNYNAMASNEADPYGNVNTNYDTMGMLARGTSATNPNLNGISVSMFTISDFPSYIQVTPNDVNYTKSGGNLPGGDAYKASEAGVYGVENAKSHNDLFIMKADGRTARFGLTSNPGGMNVTDCVRNPALNGTQGDTNYGGASNSSNHFGYKTNVPGSGNAGTYYVTNSTNLIWPGMLGANSLGNGAGAYYYDYNSLDTASNQQKGIVRPGDDYFNELLSSLNPNSWNTPPFNNIYQATTGGNDGPTVGNPAAAISPTSYDARPVVLHRPFRNVGELGYVFRDMPYKSLDMCSDVSVDAALLDFFTVDAAQTPLVAGKVDMNTRQPQVLQCILNGSFRMGDPTLPTPPALAAGIVTMGPNAAKVIAQNIVTITTAAGGTTFGPSSTGPLQNKAELVTRLAAPQNTPYTTSTIFDSNPYSGNLSSGVYPAIATDTPAAVPTTLYPSIKSQREAPVRALADVANTRTWNLLIDVVAQTGQYAPTNTTDLKQFIVTGERRYWLHVAIDRFTGKVVDQQLEPVYE